jgi:hypothetical protein
MLRSAPRISHRLLETLERLDDGRIGFGELTRRLGEEAERLGIPRPSYQQVRVLAQELRAVRGGRPTTGEVLLDVATRARPPEAIVDHVAGTLPPK